MTRADDLSTLGRRAFFRDTTLCLLGAGWAGAQAASALAGEAPAPDQAAGPRVRFGLVTDLHYADKASAGSRAYREAPAKLAEAAAQFRQARTDFVVELGDFIDAADSVEQERSYLEQIHKQFATLPGPHHYVLGNHCVYSLTKPEFLQTVGRRETYYAFDAGGYHFVVLDACFRQDGTPYGRKNAEWTDANLPAEELDWLRADLSRTSAKTVVLIHQCLDVDPPYGLKNASQVRQILEASGRVMAVLQGHHHRPAYRRLAGIHYGTLAAMVDGTGPEHNAYAIVEILSDDSLRVTGFRQQPSYTWTTGAGDSARG